MLRRFLLAAALVSASGLTQAQTSTSAPSEARVRQAVDAAEEAYGEGRYDDAVTILEPIVDRSGNASLHYLLGRILYDTSNPNRNPGRADREIGRAIDLEPDNVVYLVARLEGLRRDAWNIFLELILARQRVALAERILTLDPDNAYAHEELGAAAIAGYYQYRNAVRIAVPSFYQVGSEQFAQAEQDRDLKGEEREARIAGSAGEIDPDGIPLTETGLESEKAAGISEGVYATNRFDIDRLREQGTPVTSYASLAQRSYDRAIVHLRKALESDPRRRSVYDHFVRLAALSGRYDEVSPTLDEMYVQFPDDVRMWLYVGLTDHRLGNYEGADLAFREALARMDAPTRAAFTDLTMILPLDERAAFRADPEAFARRYWTSRDPRFLNTVNERQTEHYARLVYADLLYRSEDLNLPGWRTERGELLVRYGPPLTDTMIEGGYQSVVETYAGRREGFVPNEAAVTANRFNVWDYGDFQLVFEDPFRNGEFRLYSPPPDVYSLSNARGVQEMDFVTRAREQIRQTPERYTFEAPGRRVELPYRVTAFKGDEGRTDLYVNYGVPLGPAAPVAQGEVQPTVDVTVKTGAFLIGPDRDLLVERRRTIYGLQGSQIVTFGEARLWTSTEPMTARPGPHEVSLEFETASGGTSAVQRRGVDVPDFSGDGLQLSDVLLAYSVTESDGEAPGRVVRDGLSIQPAPWGVFSVDDPIYLFFEVYGLALPGGQTDYEVEARLVPKDVSTGLRRLSRRLLGRRAQGVSSAFETQGDRADDAQYVLLDAADQATGLYTLTVTVRDRNTGRTAQRETELLLEE